MALIENILNSTEPSKLDKLLQSFEFENKQYVKLIEKENQQIEAFINERDKKKNSICELQVAITKLDDDTKRSHRQFTQNRENCESLRKTTVVLMEHEVALHKKLTSILMTGENDRAERDGVLQHYKNIWEDYAATYKTFPLAMKLYQQEEEYSALSHEVETARIHANNLKEQIKIVQGDDGVNLRSLNNFITKLAEVKIETSKVTEQINQTIRAKQNLENELKEIINNKKEQLENSSKDTIMETNSRDSLEKSTMIGMYCNMTDETEGDPVDVAILNTNNNREVISDHNEGGTSVEESMYTEDIQDKQVSQTVSSSSSFGDTVRVSEQVTSVEPMQISPAKPSRTHIVKPSCSISVNTQIPQIPKLHQRMPDGPQPIQMATNIVSSVGQQGVQLLPTQQPQTNANQRDVNHRIIQYQKKPQPRAGQLMSPRVPTLLVPQQLNRSQLAPRQQHSTNSGQLFLPTRSPSQNTMPPRSPMVQIPTLSNTVVSIKHGQPQASPYKSPVYCQKASSSPIKPPRQGPRIPQSPLANTQQQQHHQPQSFASNSPKTPKAHTQSASNGNSPFDLNKHLEQMKNLKKSPGVMPFKGRAMFADVSNANNVSNDNNFLLPFNQPTTQSPNVSSSDFNMSCFTNISSPETTSPPVFNFSSDSMAREQGSANNSSFMGLFGQSEDNPDEAKTGSSGFSFSFGGNDSGVQSPEQSDFTLNFTSNNSQSSNVFSLF